MSDRIPTVHDMDIVSALDFYYQHHNDAPDDYTQACADFEMDEAITIKRAMNEIASLRARLERAREAAGECKCACITRRGVKKHECARCKILRELDNGGGDVS